MKKLLLIVALWGLGTPAVWGEESRQEPEVIYLSPYHGLLVDPGLKLSKLGALGTGEMPSCPPAPVCPPTPACPEAPACESAPVAEAEPARQAKPLPPTVTVLTTSELSKKDIYQAEQWLRIMNGFWAMQDYPMLRYYCQKTVEFYPGTSYAAKAEKYLEKMGKPAVVRTRKFIDDNPGLFPFF
ncbi:MAG: hypothetical protein HYU99_10390 [Deltaproteobacteria bacterium]|nr:hypothetical protein [Deltaproteobacteria bacterium]